jgi:HNH endonuclease/NUMOD1 domain/NUMOD4 motif
MDVSLPVICLTSHDVEIKVYESARKAAIDLGIDSSGITKVCKGKRKTCGGYKWKYGEKTLPTFPKGGKLHPKYKSYAIYKDGRVYGLAMKKFLKPQNGSDGYISVGVSLNGKRKHKLIHILVAQTYIKNDDKNKIEVNHKDRNKENNNVDNLEWVTHGENMKHFHDNKITKQLSYDDNDKKENKIELEDELWTEILDEEDYLISNYGRLYSNKIGHYLRPTIDKKGYASIKLNNENFKVHVLVLKLFEGDYPEDMINPQVHHIDSNPSNNHISNLKWVTSKENIELSYEIGERNTYPIIRYDLNMKKIATYKSCSEAAKILGISYQAIYKCCIGESKTCDSSIFKYK